MLIVATPPVLPHLLIAEGRRLNLWHLDLARARQFFLHPCAAQLWRLAGNPPCERLPWAHPKEAVSLSFWPPAKSINLHGPSKAVVILTSGQPESSDQALAPARPRKQRNHPGQRVSSSVPGAGPVELQILVERVDFAWRSWLRLQLPLHPRGAANVPRESGRTRKNLPPWTLWGRHSRRELDLDAIDPGDCNVTRAAHRQTPHEKSRPASQIIALTSRATGRVQRGKLLR